MVLTEYLCMSIPYTDRIFKPDGHKGCECQKFPERDLGVLLSPKVKTVIGVGQSNSVHQAHCDYVASSYSKCVFSAFLLGIAMIIAGAAFTNRFISQGGWFL